MKYLKSGVAAVLLLAPLLIASTGCVAVVAGGAAAGTVAYVRGNLEVVFERPVDPVADAALKTMEAMEFAVVSSETDAVTGKIVARNAADKRITITLKALTESTTKISIRVGYFGDEYVSQQVYDGIKERL